jgi:hypothetical protein
MRPIFVCMEKKQVVLAASLRQASSYKLPTMGYPSTDQKLIL